MTAQASGFSSRRNGSAFNVLCVLCGLVAGLSGCAGRGQQYSTFITPTPLPAQPRQTLILGFLGGRQPWNSATEATRRLALRLREKNLPGVHVETVENRKRELALELIHRAFDRTGDGALDEVESSSVRLILYGQSYGGAAVVKLARQLHRQGVPVLLTVQVDSIGLGDEGIPPNVRRAANLYQDDGWVIEGEPEIVAEDPEQTEILGNFRFSYKDKEIDLSEVPWHKKIFRIAHSKMNLDPEVWRQVEELIIEEIR